jgi:hypothetical protein
MHNASIREDKRDQARVAAERAVELAPDLADAHPGLASTHKKMRKQSQVVDLHNGGVSFRRNVLAGPKQAVGPRSACSQANGGGPQRAVRGQIMLNAEIAPSMLRPRRETKNLDLGPEKHKPKKRNQTAG